MPYDKNVLRELVNEYMTLEEQPRVEDLIDGDQLSTVASGLLGIFDGMWENGELEETQYTELCNKLGMSSEKRAELRSHSKHFLKYANKRMQ